MKLDELIKEIQDLKISSKDNKIIIEKLEKGE